MRTTVTVDDELLSRAEELTGTTQRSEMINRGLETLVR